MKNVSIYFCSESLNTIILTVGILTEHPELGLEERR